MSAEDFDDYQPFSTTEKMPKWATWMMAYAGINKSSFYIAELTFLQEEVISLIGQLAELQRRDNLIVLNDEHGEPTVRFSLRNIIDAMRVHEAEEKSCQLERK